MTMKINFIGCGRLGKTLGKLLQLTNSATIVGIVNSSLESASLAAEFISSGTAYKSIRELPPADIYFIATLDDAIQAACEELTAAHRLENGNIVLHCSGSLSADILNAVKPFNCSVASIHPLKSFANPEESIKNFTGTYCAIEGDASAILAITPLFEKIGAKVFPIKKEMKSVYHAAGVLANNYLVTLHYLAVQSYTAAGVDELAAKQIVSMLMQDALNHLNVLPYQKALTGPIQRGDLQTVTQHMNSLNSNPLVKNIYTLLGLATLPITQHVEEKKAELEELLAISTAV